MKYQVALTLILLVAYTNGLSLLLTSPRTCMNLEATEDKQKFLINYHHNLHNGTAALNIYGNNGQLLATSGEGAEYKHNLEV